MNMPGLGLIELSVIFLLVLILFGPGELPKLARMLARLIYEMKNIFRRLEKEWDLLSATQEDRKKNPERQDQES